MIKPRTVKVDGLEFIEPTWDRTPHPQNPRGSWAEDPELTERVLAGIRAAVPNHEELVAEALARPKGDGTCGTFWGSHGCDGTAGHDGLHVCGTPDDLCSAGLPYGESDTLILWWADEHGGLRLARHHWRWFR